MSQVVRQLRLKSRIKGNVLFYNNIKGLGKISGEDGRTYFVHESKIEQPGFRGLVPGQPVTFAPDPGGRKNRGRDEDVLALAVRTENQALRESNEEPTIEATDLDTIHLRVDKGGRIYCLNAATAVRPNVEAETFRAFKVRDYKSSLKSLRFQLTIPESSEETAFVLMDTAKKERAREHGLFRNVVVGSYVLVLDSYGHCNIFCIGVREQRDSNNCFQDAYVVVERRLSLHLDIDAADYESLVTQIPNTGLKRDNNGFIYAIMAAIDMMHQRRLAKLENSGLGITKEDLAIGVSNALAANGSGDAH